MIIIHAKFHINSAKNQTFLEEIRRLITASRAENGNISYDLMADTENEWMYTMVEVWQDLEAVNSHNKSDHFTAFVDKAQRYLAAPLDITIYEGEQLKK